VAVQQTREQYSCILPSGPGSSTPSIWRLHRAGDSAFDLKPSAGWAFRIEHAMDLRERHDPGRSAVAVLAVARRVVVEARGHDDGSGLDLRLYRFRAEVDAAATGGDGACAAARARTPIDRRQIGLRARVRLVDGPAAAQSVVEVIGYFHGAGGGRDGGQPGQFSGYATWRGP
jgi:hypothetical protein